MSLSEVPFGQQSAGQNNAENARYPGAIRAASPRDTHRESVSAPRPSLTVPYTQAEIDHLRNALVELIEELSGAIADTAGAARPVQLDQPTVGRVSRIDAIQQQKMTEANRSAQLARLGLARSALHRLEGDEFGECFACGEEIGIQRLDVRPESLYCIECQTTRERS